MRIIQLVESLDVGGLERMAVDLALAQQAAGHDVGFYCLHGAGALRSELDAARIPVIQFQKKHGSRSVIWKMTAQLRRDRADVIHGHNPGVHHFAAIAKQLAGVRLCINTRHSAATSTGAPYQERYFRWVQPFTDHVVFVCDAVRRELEPRLRYPARKCSVILNGIPLEKFLARQALPGSTGPAIRFGTIGRLTPAKGHAVLIEAFAQIAGALPEAKLQIFGYGALEDQLRDQIRRLGMTGRITLEGRTADSPAVLQSLDIFVFSSVNEGLPLVILEAMAAGLPIVSTRVGGVPEVAPAALFPWFCNPGDVSGLARAMLEAAQSPELAAIGAAARRLAASRYGIAHMSAAYEALYLKLLKN